MPETQDDVTALARAADSSTRDQSSSAHEREKLPSWPEFQVNVPTRPSGSDDADESSRAQQPTPPQSPQSQPGGSPRPEAPDGPRSYHEQAENAVREQSSAEATSVSRDADPSHGEPQRATSPTSSTRPLPPTSLLLHTPPSPYFAPFALPSQTPTTNSSFLRAGSRFAGIQQSDHQKYNVTVEFKYVDLSSSFLCGYLTIAGLTPSPQNITTYFEAEIIGPRYTFITNHPSWGATPKIDMDHWDKFPAFRPLAKAARRGEKTQGLLGGGDDDGVGATGGGKEHIFMRWKEAFLVPDHRVREIFGASFEGFYYVCASRVTGSIQGIYFHARSEKAVDHG